MGNPRLYGGWVDESLNKTLRTAAQHAHRINLECRVFELFDIQGGLDLGCEIFGVELEL